MAREHLHDVQASGFDEVIQIRLDLVQQLIHTAMLRSLVGRQFLFARGDDARPRRVYRELAVPGVEELVAPWFVMSPTYDTTPTPDIRPLIQLLPEFSSEPVRENDEAAPTLKDVITFGLPTLALVPLPAMPTPLPRGGQFVAALLPPGARPVDMGVAITVDVQFDSARFAEAGHADVSSIRYVATIVVRPFLDAGVIRVERYNVRLELEHTTLRPGLDAIAAPEVLACLLAILPHWSFSTALAGGPVMHVRVDPTETDVLVLGVGAGDPWRLRSCLEGHETFGAAFPPAYQGVALSLASRLFEGLPILDIPGPYHAWSAALAITTRTEPLIDESGALVAVRADAVLCGRWLSARVTGIYREGRRIHSLAFNYRYHLTVERLHNLVATGQMVLADDLQFVQTKRSLYVRDRPDGDPDDNLSLKPRFDPKSTSMRDANHRPDFPIPAGKYLYRRGTTLGSRGHGHGRPDALEAYPPAPDTVVVMVHGVDNHQNDRNMEGFVHALRAHHQPERMERVTFFRMYWGYDEFYHAADGPGERVDQVEGLSERAWAAVAKLKRLVSEIREGLGDVPITVVSHSNGAAVTLAALQEGLTVDNWVIMASPMSVSNIRNASDNTRLADAAANVRGIVLNLYAESDGIVKLKEGWGSGFINYYPGIDAEPSIGRAGLPTHDQGGFDIAGYPKAGRENIQESWLISTVDENGLDHSDYWNGYWLYDPRVTFGHPAMPGLVATMILADNLPPRATPSLTFAKQRELATWQQNLAHWSTNTTSGSWWTEDGDLDMWDDVVLLPGLTTTFHVDDANKGTARLHCSKGSLRVRMREVEYDDESWASQWYDAPAGGYAWIERDGGGIDATVLVEVTNPATEISRGKLLFHTSG